MPLPYYVSQALLQQRKEDAGSLPRLPAHDFEALVSGRIVEVLGADARLKAALVKVGWNNAHDHQRLLRIIIKRIEVAKGLVRVQIDPATALADEAEGPRPVFELIMRRYNRFAVPFLISAKFRRTPRRFTLIPLSEPV